ncbi:MAG TPA: hypothetical protein VMW16_08945 [Sedimentisphaerales bacterium]|nr:hypothetical protein [Sedimentisphaerales bacterium]
MHGPIDGWGIDAFEPGWSEPIVECFPSGNICNKTVTVSGSCYANDAVNYWLWGKINWLCGKDDKYEMIPAIYA